MRKILRLDRGSVVIEATIYFPIVVIMILILLIYGTMWYQQNLLNTAANQIAILYSQQLRDPSFNKNFKGSLEQNIDFIDYSEIRPYRYILGNPSNEGILYNLASAIVKQSILNSSNSLQIEFSKDSYFIANQYTIKLIQVHQFPLAGEYQLYGISKVVVTDPVEFIRNTDIAFESLRRIDNKLAITEKIKTLFAKVRHFLTLNR